MIEYQTAAIIYHDPIQGLSDEMHAGHIVRYLNNHLVLNVDYYCTAHDDLPDHTDDYDLVFILQGKASLCEDQDRIFLDREIALVQQRIEKQQKTIGICLGAQILAVAAGGQVKRNKFYEFGLHPIYFHHELEHPVLVGLPKTEIFWHSHHDGIIPPIGCYSLAHSDATLIEPEHNISQMFVHDHFLGIQFHPETTTELFDHVFKSMPDRQDTYCQNKELLQQLIPLYLSNHQDPQENCARDVFFTILNNFLYPR